MQGFVGVFLHQNKNVKIYLVSLQNKERHRNSLMFCWIRFLIGALIKTQRLFDWQSLCEWVCVCPSACRGRTVRKVLSL